MPLSQVKCQNNRCSCMEVVGYVYGPCASWVILSPKRPVEYWDCFYKNLHQPLPISFYRRNSLSFLPSSHLSLITFAYLTLQEVFFLFSFILPPFSFCVFPDSVFSQSHPGDSNSVFYITGHLFQSPSLYFSKIMKVWKKVFSQNSKFPALFSHPLTFQYDFSIWKNLGIFTETIQ